MDNNLYEKAYHFAKGMVNAYQHLSKEKKENSRNKIFAEPSKGSDFITQKMFDDVYDEADELAKITYSILKTTRINPKKN